MAWLVIGIGISGSNWAAAQSAADKSTARQLATEGIQLFRQDRFADALDKLERAESLFDAPVHLLYIARCQAKLNHLVEATETYRRLVRVELQAQAPQTFKDAVADGQKELPAIEPKVPSLRIEVVPANAKDLRLSIDGEVVSTAVLGVDRPINPGSHVVEISAKGQAPISRRIDVVLASKQVVKLELSGAQGSVTGPTASAARDGTTTTSNTTDGSGAAGGSVESNAVASSADAGRTESAPVDEKKRFKIIAGIDLTGALPLGGKLDGQSYTQAGTGVADDRSISGRYGPGGGLELRAGFAIPLGRYYVTPLLFGGGNSHTPGTLYKTSADRAFGLPNSVNSVMTAEPISVSMGLGIRLDTAPQRAFSLGGFGEFGVVVRQAYSTNGTWTISQGTVDWPAGSKCDFTEEFNGWGIRARGGALMPVSRVVTLVGAAGFTVARINSAGLTSKKCDPDSLADQFGVGSKVEVPAGSRQYHTVFGISLGAEFGLGLGH